MTKLAWVEVGIVLAIMALAIGFRFYDIQYYPPGLFPDQAANGEDALSILHGDIRPFYERGNGREALFFYLQALMIYLFGIGVWPMFVASAIVGTLTVIATYFATRVWFGRVAGLAAALFLATNHWQVTISRTGFRAVMIPLFIALFTAFVGYMIQAVQKKQTARAWTFAILAGVAFAGGFYTYIAYRAMLGVLLAMALVLIIRAAVTHTGTQWLREYAHLTAAALIAALLTYLPLGLYFVQHPGSFVGRSSQVSIFNPDLQQPGGLVPTIAVVTQKTILSFFVGGGDLNWRHNVAGYPLLNPLVGGLFLVGLGVTLWQAIRSSHPVSLYALFLLGALLLPVITTAEGIPHALRSMGLLFPVFWLVGRGAAVAYRHVTRLSSAPLRAASYGMAAGAIVIGLFYDGSLYFLIARHDAEAHAAYRADLTIVSQYINEYVKAHAEAPRPYLVLDAFSVQTVHFLTHTTDGELPYRLLQPELSHLTPVHRDEMVVYTQSTLPDADRAQNLELLESRRNWFNQEIMRVYRAREGSPKTIPDDASLDA